MSTLTYFKIKSNIKRSVLPVPYLKYERENTVETVEYMINFAVLKGSNGQVVGFSLVADAQTEAEEYVRTLQKALPAQTATWLIEGNKIVFNHPTCPNFGGNHEFTADPQELTELQQVLQGSRGQLTITSKGVALLTPGFKIVLRSEVK